MPRKQPSSAPTRPRSKPLPGTYLRFAERFPALVQSHRDMTAAAEQAGPLDPRTCELIRIGIALGGGHETSFHSHVRRALEHGARREEIEQAIVLTMTTCGFSRAVAGWRWAQEHFSTEGPAPRRRKLGSG